MKLARSIAYVFFFLLASRLLMTASVRVLAFILIGSLPFVHMCYERTRLMEFRIAGAAIAISLVFIVYRHDLHYRGVDPDVIVTITPSNTKLRYSREYADHLNAEMRAKYGGDSAAAYKDLRKQQLELRERGKALKERIEERAKKREKKRASD